MKKLTNNKGTGFFFDKLMSLNTKIKPSKGG